MAAAGDRNGAAVLRRAAAEEQVLGFDVSMRHRMRVAVSNALEQRQRNGVKRGARGLAGNRGEPATCWLNGTMIMGQRKQ